MVHETKPTTSTRLVEIPTPRQRFLGLYILYCIAKPTRSKTTSAGEAPPKDSFSQTITHPKTETDELVASLPYVYEQHQRGSPSGLEPELLFVLAYWKSIREGNWIHRERLLEQRPPGSSAQGSTISWDQQLMIQHSMGDPLRSARTVSVAIMSKAYYSLPLVVMAQAVGLSGPQGRTELSAQPDAIANEQWLQKLRSSYGLSPSIVLRDGQLMLKVKR